MVVDGKEVAEDGFKLDVASFVVDDKLFEVEDEKEEEEEEDDDDEMS